MLEPSHLPGIRWFDAIRNEALRTGVYVGVCLSAVFTVWVYAANRVPALERFAWERNVAAAAVLGLLALVPILRFLRHPAHLFLAGETAWFLFALAYRVLIFLFPGLAQRLTAPHLFVLGAVVYGLIAMLLRILHLILFIRSAATSPHGGAHHAR